MQRLTLVFALLAPLAAAGAEVRVISTAELRDLLEKRRGDVLVDSRGRTEFGEGHIVGAVNLPASATKARLASIAPDRTKTVVFYCSGPECIMSRKAAKAAVGLGYAHVREYVDGLPGWKKAGLPVEGTPLPPFELPPGTPPDALKALLAGANPPAVLDIREEGEFAAFHLPGSKCIPLDELAGRAAEIPAGPLVVVDHSGQRIPVSARVLAKLGHRDLRWLKGGLLSWMDAGLETVEGK